MSQRTPGLCVKIKLYKMPALRSFIEISKKTTILVITCTCTFVRSFSTLILLAGSFEL